jgi:hypothetical protein
MRYRVVGGGVVRYRAGGGDNEVQGCRRRGSEVQSWRRRQ